MISYNVNTSNMYNDKHYVEGSCLSTDTKPTDVANGSKLIEMDTGKLYCFDEAGSTWRDI